MLSYQSVSQPVSVTTHQCDVPRRDKARLITAHATRSRSATQQTSQKAHDSTRTLFSEGALQTAKEFSLTETGTVSFLT